MKHWFFSEGRLRPTSQLTVFLLRCLRLHCWWRLSLSLFLSLSLSLRSATSVKSNISPTLAMTQILQLTKPSVFSGGCRAHWHSWVDANPCVPCRHSTTLIISLRCLLKSFSFVRGGGALQKIATQGCDLRARLATCSDLRDSPVFKPPPPLNGSGEGQRLRFFQLVKSKIAMTLV